MSAPDPVTEAAAIASLALAAAEPKVLSPTELYSIVVPAGASSQVLDLERYLPAPRRKFGIYRPADVESFLTYAGEHRDAERTTIWVDQLSSKVLALLDDHSASGSAWGEHRVELQLTHTPEWRHWTAKDGQFLSQEDFADHLQEGITEIHDPPAAEMLEIAQTIQGKTSAEWKTATRLATGEVSFNYSEKIDATAGRQGNLAIPEVITLAISPFYGEAPFEIAARLRYKIREGNLRIGYKLERPHEVVQAVLKVIVDRIRAAGFGHVYMGKPRGAA